MRRKSDPAREAPGAGRPGTALASWNESPLRDLGLGWSMHPDGPAADSAAGVRAERLLGRLKTRALQESAERSVGRVSRIVGLTVESAGPRARLGDRAEIEAEEGSLPAEVVGFRDGRVLLMPLGDARRVAPGARVTADGRPFTVRVGKNLLGRTVDGLGLPIDGLGPLGGPRWETERRPPAAQERAPIRTALSTGVRAIDGLCTVGRGQRLGIFAGSGVGKSTLLGMIAREAAADVIVIGLIGERGREVRDFLDDVLGSEALRRATVVVATSDEPARVRIRAAQVATTIAEAFRAEGLDVLLIVDSITRYAMALREVGLAVGEPPTARGYTPSVFAELPRLLERAGTAREGSITAFYTVLVDGDDMTEPITDSVRSIVDGHIVLTRSLAELGHFPAIDPAQSVSRLMGEVASPRHVRAAVRLRSLWTTYEESADLLRIGAYTPGSMPELDRAVQGRSDIEAFLRQDLGQHTPLVETEERLFAMAERWGF